MKPVKNGTDPGRRVKKNDDLDEYEDVTVAEMNVEGMPGYRDPETKRRQKEMRDLNLSPAERKAMIKGAFSAMLPAFLIGLGLFCLAFLLVMLYFRSVL